MSSFARVLATLCTLALFTLSPDLSAGGGSMPEIKVPLGGKPVKFKVDLGFKLTCPHKLLSSVQNGSVAQVDQSDGFTKNPTYTITGLDLGSTIVTFDIIAKDTFEMTMGSCQGSASQQAMITVVPDLTSVGKTDSKSYSSIGKSYKKDLSDIRKNNKQFFGSQQKSFKKGEIDYDTLVDIFFEQSAGSMEQAYQLGMTALVDGASIGSSTLSSFGQDGYHTDTYMAGGGGSYDKFFTGVTEDWWGVAQSIGPELRKQMDRLNKASDLPEDEQVEFNFVGTWATFAQEPGPVGDFDDAVTDVGRRPLKILCAATRAQKCDPSSGALSVGGWAEPGSDVHVSIFGPDGYEDDDTDTADLDGGFGIQFQLSFFDAAPGTLASGLYRVEVTYSGEAEGDRLFIQIP